jgi:Ubiquitin fusion degradation protein UFD1
MMQRLSHLSLLSIVVWASLVCVDAEMPVPISLKHGISKYFQSKLSQAKELAALEQEVEDYNAVLIASAKNRAESTAKRRLICLPLDDRFDPPMGQFSHEHIQTGDKMSLPGVFWEAIGTNAAQVPWLFSVSRVDGVTGERVDVPEDLAALKLDEVVGGPLDFRAPQNYVFLPWWMMRALGLQPRDVVDVKLVTTVAPGSLAKLRPHSSSFAKDISNPQAVLETELRHYSSLTKGSTIAFDYNSKRYWFDVVELRSAPRGDKQPMVKVQDCDIATDFLISKEEMKKRKEKKEQKELDG